MDLTLHPSEISGVVKAPPGKSMMQRVIAAGLLAEGITIIRNPSLCQDSRAALKIAESLGAKIEIQDNLVRIEGANELNHNAKELHCGESGLAMRMFAPIASLMNAPVRFTGKGSLLRRPVQMIGEALSQLGVNFIDTEGCLPFTVTGPLRGGNISVDGSVSSQLLTGLLFALPLCKEDSEIKVYNLKSKPYIALTLDVLEYFGIEIENHEYETFMIRGRQAFRAKECIIEGDWSNAAFLLVAGAINGSIEVSGLNFSSRQADLSVLEALQHAGALMVITGSSISVTSAQLTSFYFDATDCPDLFPPLAALAAYCEGISVIRGCSRLFHKESNRAQTIINTLEALKVRAELMGDELHVYGGKISGGKVTSHNDHRIAMMAAVLALGANGPVTIQDAECVDKSFPDFFRVLSETGVWIE